MQLDTRIHAADRVFRLLADVAAAEQRIGAAPYRDRAVLVRADIRRRQPGKPDGIACVDGIVHLCLCRARAGQSVAEGDVVVATVEAVAV